MKQESELIPFVPFDPVGKRVLVLAPHPDDETIGCGGTLALHRLAGGPVRVVFLTDGSKGTADACVTAEQCARERRQEALAACAALGISDVVFWDYEDRRLCDARCSLNRLIETIEDFRPERIYVPSILEFHPDHRMTAFLIGDFASSVAGFDDVEIWMYEVNQPVCVNTLVDISPVLDRKQSALACYASQLKVRPYDAVSLALNRFRSLTLPEGCTHAEGFFRCTLGDIRKNGLYGLPIVCIDRYRPAVWESGPLVSILIRTKDRLQHLANAIRSVVGQTYRHIEIVVVNDGGEDVQGLVEREARGLPVTYIRHETSKGRASAANAALTAARGAWLNFLDDDDVLYPDHVETLIRKLQECGGDAAYGGVRTCRYRSVETVSEGPLSEEIRFNHPFDPDVLLFENYLPIMSVLFSKAALSEMERWFDERLILFEDWDFWIRLSRGRAFHHVDAITAEYRLYGEEDIEEAHRSKYRYDEAQADLFDRAKPWMDGKAWLQFQRKGSYGELKRQNEGLASELFRLRRHAEALEQRLCALESLRSEEIRGLVEALSSERMQQVDTWIERLAEQATALQDVMQEWRAFQGARRECPDSPGEACMPNRPGSIRRFLRRIEALCRFDPDWYRRQYPDVAASGRSPLVHFLLHGMREGRQSFDMNK
ncbi:PIG-L family deacetylase [Desulfatirhabdium butyrativorans]|uniref:PIG-L family deacetylase n=1 Tax=Desulfatirhabdium butyrativorans TaxID=340467 RepID=UPI0004071BA6|nr:PIG-L family deacetylase [Desulfatirhabdium butyrativorans]